eukprot:scaffold103153_cov45-Phaeocystis_antarctica.AAC.1
MPRTAVPGNAAIVAARGRGVVGPAGSWHGVQAALRSVGGLAGHTGMSPALVDVETEEGLVQNSHQ